jgi:hypothetical protein
MGISDIVATVDDTSRAASKLRSEASGDKQEVNEKSERARNKSEEAVSIRRKPSYFPSPGS